MHGRSTATRCVFDATTRQVIFDGRLAPDPGATDATTAAHAAIIVLTTRLTTVTGLLSNQAQTYWDAAGDGTVTDDLHNGQVPALSDDPTTPAGGDPTQVRLPEPPPEPIPTLSRWSALILGLLILGIGCQRMGYSKRYRRL